MARVFAALLVAGIFVGNEAAGEAVSVTPIQKVLQMMESMKTKAIEEKEAEAVRFSAFKQFCGDTSRQKTDAIARSGREIEMLEGEILAAAAEITKLQQETAELEEDIGRWKKDSAAAADVREKEKADFTATQAEYVDIIAACEQAVLVLRQHGKVPQSESLLQLASRPRVPEPVRKSLLSLLETGKGIEVSNPDAYAYEAQSGGVKKMLEDLRQRFRGELAELEKEELTAVHAYEDLAQKLRDQSAMAQRGVEQRSQVLVERQADKAEAEGNKKQTEEVKAQDETYLSDLKVLCEQKSKDFESRQELRAREIEALGKAVEIMGSDAINSDRLPGAAAASASALVQVKRKDEGAPLVRRVASLLHERASKLDSKTLLLAAQRADEDPFAKVKKMISDLIVKLQEQAAAEADEKAWCDAEVATNTQTRQIKQATVDDLTAEAEKLTAQSARLSQEIADLSDEVTSIDKAIANATAEREKEKAENEAAIADAKESSTAVAQALAVLREFYAKAAEATSLAQQSPAEDAPETFDAPYQGQQGESTGVIGMLEVIESDFTRLESETDAAEQAAVEEHRKFMAESEKNKAVANAAIEHNTQRKDQTEQYLVSTKNSLASTQDELDAANKYWNQLEPKCVDPGVSYEDRVKKREEELESLRDAYKIISGEEVPSLQDMKAEQIGTGLSAQYD